MVMREARSSGLMVIVELPVLMILLLLWASVGFLYWIPLLVRMIAYYTFTVLRVALGVTENVDDAMESLGFAVGFYGRGFRMMLGVFDFSNNQTAAFGNEFSSGGGMETWFKLLFQTAWTAVFWGATVMVIILFL